MVKAMTILLNVFVESAELEAVTKQLQRVPEVIDLYEVTGEYDLVALLELDSITAFRQLLKDRILRIKGIRSTVSAVVIHSHKKDGKPVAD